LTYDNKARSHLIKHMNTYSTLDDPLWISKLRLVV